MTKITRKTGCTPWRAERRVYPPRQRGDLPLWTTRAYVEAFFRMNTDQPSLRYGSNRVHAYDRAPYVDHLALYQPLSTRLQEWPEEQDSEAERGCARLHAAAGA